MKKFLAVILVMVLVVSLSVGLVGCKKEGIDNNNVAADRQPIDKSDVKVGFIYIGPVGDGGWTDAHNNGRLYLEKELGVETMIQETVSEGPQCIEVAKSMIDSGCNVIFATSFGYMNYIEEVASEYPEVTFIHCSGFKMAENFGNYFGRIYEPRYLSGIVAGMQTETNKIGYVAAMSIPEVIRGINAFTLGVKSVNPDATVKVVWTNTWIDPAKAKEAAKALLAEDCDVISQHQDAPGPLQAAQDKGVWGIGYDLDMTQVAPDAHLTAPVFNWGPYYVEQVQKVIDGTWKAESYWGGLKDGIVDLAPIADFAPEGAKERVAEVRSEIEAGTFHPFQGPIKDQDGNEVVKDGETISDQDLLGMMYFVEGVEGIIPE